MSRWQDERAERNRQAIARLNRALPDIFPPMVLARALGRRAGKAVAVRALVRSRATESQGDMPSARARRRNVLGVFKVREPALVQGRNILLVDDVLTTGATADSCARALKRAGAAKVQILALARVVKGSEASV